MTRRRPRRGYVLLEIVVDLALMGLFLVVAGQLFMHCMGVQRDAIKLESMVSETRAATTHLQSDVWSARGWRVDGSTLAIEAREGATVTWSSERGSDSDAGDGEVWLVREAVGDVRRWRVPGGLSFEVLDERGVAMHVGETTLSFLSVPGRIEGDER
ncbi:MAG: type II secretion system protein [Planctomycetota bacterium]